MPTKSPWRDACPIFPSKKYLDWALEDPAGMGVEAVRPIRDEIKPRIEALIAEIDAKEGATSATAAGVPSTWYFGGARKCRALA